MFFKGYVLVIYRDPEHLYFIILRREYFRNFYLSNGNFADNNFQKMKSYSEETD